MLDGIFYNPTMIMFGKNTELSVGKEIAKHSMKILLHFGGNSFKKHGLYDRVTDSLKAAGVSYVELGGVQPNPLASLVYDGIKLCRKENIDLILAVGGGSVIDSAKAISIGVPYEGDFIDFFEGTNSPKQAINVCSILTIPGAGSESSPTSVILHDEKCLKLSCSNYLMFPLFSILNPELTYTLPFHYTSSGIVDAMSHVMERYFTNTTFVDCTDRIGEGILKTLMNYSLQVKQNPNNYDVRAEIMWACKLSHDNIAGFGRKQDWASHSIAHELGAMYSVTHGMALSVIFPAWMQYVYSTNIDRFVQFSNRLFDIKIGSSAPDKIVLTAIDKFKSFLESMEMPTSLRELGIHQKTDFYEISRRCVIYMKSGTIGNFVRLSPQDITNILEIAY